MTVWSLSRLLVLLGCLAAGGESLAAAHARRPAHQDCAEALADGTLVDPGQAGALVALAATLKWPDDGAGAVAPADRPRAVRLFCGPDLDHDGDPESIVEVRWRSRDDEAATSEDGGAEVTRTFLASRHGTVWRAVAPLASSSDDDEAAPPSRRAYFVRRPRGETAIRVEWTSAASDKGCALGGFELFALRRGVLHRLGGGDSSRACIPCGCHDR